MTVGVRLYAVGDQGNTTPDIPDEIPVEDSFFPEPAWGQRKSENREPESDEVDATKVLLAGGLGLWLDDGERIRALDPRLPEGERVGYETVTNIQPGTYLVLREGATERGAMYVAAMAAVGERADEIAETQARWKCALAERLDRKGVKWVTAELRARNIRSATRARAWIEPTLICPRHEEDLSLLLAWLEISTEPTFANAIALRRALYRASADLRHELEEAVSKADLEALQRNGSMRLELEREGFRGMIVARVLARAPFTEIVARPQTRIPFPDSGAQWLE